MKYLVILLILCFSQMCAPEPHDTHTVTYYFSIFNQTQSEVTLKLLEPYGGEDCKKNEIDSVTYIIPPTSQIIFKYKGKSDKYDSHLSYLTGGVSPLWENIDYIMVADTIYDKRLWCSENRWDPYCLGSFCLCTDYAYDLNIK